MAELESCGGNVGGNCTAFPFPSTLISLQVCTIAHVILTEMQWWADAKISIASYNASHQLLLLKQKIKSILGVGLRRPKMKGVQSLIGCFWPLCGAGGGGSAI